MHYIAAVNKSPLIVLQRGDGPVFNWGGTTVAGRPRYTLYTLRRLPSTVALSILTS
jgi:hypothetical protein